MGARKAPYLLREEGYDGGVCMVGSEKLAAALCSLCSRVGQEMGCAFFRRISILDLRISCLDSATLTCMRCMSEQTLEALCSGTHEAYHQHPPSYSQCGHVLMPVPPAAHKSCRCFSDDTVRRCE